MGGGLKAPGYGAAADGEGGVRPARTVQGMKTKEFLIPAWKEYQQHPNKRRHETMAGKAKYAKERCFLCKLKRTDDGGTHEDEERWFPQKRGASPGS